ncbi:putative bifunctional SAT/APS kinase [Pseudodesulfovibrio hydrargyri]|uniref:Putative bifunctional SAT/APS kinase n=1 Tax=Pseudodesulfovibrio hydrargyri TaxID=2125990 RepID=A0A1J5N084_9BACT|nr:adenylyl-sulfate kinase [Pseudodesulfovibrio hydrargyri]OIQ51674.1 putative bifunctional SAT/APS kinase [Pseudodesulfovibrio hydrargyri]
MADRTGEGWAIWVVGLPGSGKSTLSRGLRDALQGRGVDAVLLQMDERRKAYFPEPEYTPEERETAYRMFAEEAAGLAREGRNVILDGSAYRVSMRRTAREKIFRFAEIFVHCDLETAMVREASRPAGKVMADLYRKALVRKETGYDFDGLGDVVGVDVPFEQDPLAEFVIDNTELTEEETLRKTLHFVDTWLASV